VSVGNHGDNEEEMILREMGGEMGPLTRSLLTVMRFINDTGCYAIPVSLWSTTSVRPLAVHTRFQLS
jgi:hypothetical protein